MSNTYIDTISVNGVEHDIRAKDFSGVISAAGGGTGNTSGYIRAGLASGETAGTAATAEGYLSIATGNYSHTEGYNGMSSGIYSHAEGYAATASGEASHAEGDNTTASGKNSHAEGKSTTASANYTHAGGFHTEATHAYQTAIGLYNDNKSDTLFEIGNGDGSSARSNAMEVTTAGTVKATNFQGNVNGYSIAANVPANAVFTDTTYESKAAANGGTDVSLVTTGDKYNWNNKTSNTGDVTGPSSVTANTVAIFDGTGGKAIKSSGYTIGKSVPSDAVFTDTTYESKSASSGGTAVSLVTTGEKYNWNNKTSNTGDVTGPSSVTTNTVAVFDGTTGKAIKSSGYTIAKSVPSDAKFTDTTYSAATTSALGLVKPDGTTITVDSNGVISSSGGSISYNDVINALGYTPPTSDTNTTYLPSMSGTLGTSQGGTGNTAGYIRTGQKTGTTIGDRATAEGYNNTASRDYAHAEGYNNIASGDHAHAEGAGTTASAINSHAEGTYTTASGAYSHAEGFSTTASAINSHAEGYYTTASGEASHAEGNSTTASGNYSHAGGYYTTAGFSYQTAIGKYNSNDSNNLFEIGNGTGTSSRSNAFAVDVDGNITCSGYFNGTALRTYRIRTSAPSSGNAENGDIWIS